MFDKTLEISLICKYIQRNILQIYFISVNLEILHKLVCWYESFSHPLEPENVSLLDLFTYFTAWRETCAGYLASHYLLKKT